MSVQLSSPERSPLLIVTNFWRTLRQLARTSGPDLERLALELGEIAASIPAISQEIGVRYLHSGGVLDPLTSASESLTTQSAELLKLAIGQADGDLVVNGTTDLLATPFAYLDSWRVRVQGYVSDLTACEEVFTRLENSQVALNALVSPLKHIQTMFRIESARLPEEIRQIFSGLTEQIAAVHHEVHETFVGQFQIVSETLTTLAEVRQKISQHAGQLQKGLADRRHRVADSMDKLSSELARNGERETELTETSNAIRVSTTNVVVALQAHDICSQRLEHVCIAIAEVREILSELLSGKSRNKQAIQQAWCLLLVQAGQVDDVFKQFEVSERTLQVAVKDIFSRVIEFDDECILLKEFQEVTVATNGSVELSLEIMQDVTELLRGVISASRDFCASIQPVAAMTAKLTDALESVSNKMRLIALNAQVQAVHIGNGTGLEVLAAQTALVSTETSQNAETVSADIQRLIHVVQDLTAALQNITAEGETALEVFEANGHEHEVMLHGLRDKTLSQLQLVGDAVDQISQCTNTLREDSNVRQSAVFPLQELGNKLREISNQLKLSMSRLDRDAAANLNTNYKMKSERQVHSEVLAGLGMTGPAEAASQSLPEPNASESSIELF